MARAECLSNASADGTRGRSEVGSGEDTGNNSFSDNGSSSVEARGESFGNNGSSSIIARSISIGNIGTSSIKASISNIRTSSIKASLSKIRTSSIVAISNIRTSSIVTISNIRTTITKTRGDSISEDSTTSSKGTIIATTVGNRAIAVVYKDSRASSRLKALAGGKLNTALDNFRLEDSLCTRLSDGTLVVLADSLSEGLLDNLVLSANFLGAGGLLGNSGQNIVLSANSLLAERSAGAGGLNNGDLDDILAGGACLPDKGLFLDLDISGGDLDNSLLGFTNGGRLIGSRDDLPVNTSWALEALLGEGGLSVAVWDG